MGAQQGKETKSGKRERKSKDNRQVIQNFAQDNGLYCFTLKVYHTCPLFIRL